METQIYASCGNEDIGRLCKSAVADGHLYLLLTATVTVAVKLQYLAGSIVS